jgi:hypothetical protein
VRHVWAILAVALCLAAPARGRAEPVDLALVLAVDASTSVNYDEFALQVGGLVAAFRDPRLVGALDRAGRRGIAVMLVQWSDATRQVTAIDWTLVADARSAAAFADGLAAMPRLIDGGTTGISGASEYALHRIENSPHGARRRAIDISGDGRASSGWAPGMARDAAVAAGVTINGLVILNDEADLERYYLTHVIGGPAAFVEVAEDYHGFARAMRRKLIREISGGAIAEAEIPGTLAVAEPEG